MHRAQHRVLVYIIIVAVFVYGPKIVLSFLSFIYAYVNNLGGRTTYFVWSGTPNIGNILHQVFVGTSSNTERGAEKLTDPVITYSKINFIA